MRYLSGQDGHQGALTCLACNKDGSLMLTGSVDGCAKLINTTTGKVGAAGSLYDQREMGELFLPAALSDPVCFQVVRVFSLEGGKDKGSKEGEESNSVESVGFCNM